MSHYQGPAAINSRKTTNIQEVLETTFVRLAAHPLFNDPPILDKLGVPVRFTKMRDYDGIELKNTGPGLTISIFPYTYSSKNQPLTINSTNASIIYKPYTLGNSLGTLDECKAHIAIKLHYFGYDTVADTDPYAIQGQQTIFEFNRAEQILRRWAEVVRLILTSDLHYLPSVTLPLRNLLTNSYVNWINFETGRWEQDENLIFHTATILWEVTYYSKRRLEDSDLIDIIGGPVGTIPDPNNPGNTIPVCYDLTNDRYYNCITNETIPLAWLIDPATGTFYTTINVGVIKLVDLINSSRNDFVTISNQ